MKIVITKKESTIRLFSEPTLSPLTSFWLGKKIKEFENKTGYLVFYVMGPAPQSFKGFWGTKIIDTEGKSEEESAEIIINALEEIVKQEKKHE
ncbi:MAG: hypothetical protein ABDH49_08640 [Candidatus Hydrothermales bacterium]